MAQLPAKIVMGPRLTVERDAVFLLLKELAADNLKLYEENRSKSIHHQRIADCCTEVSCCTALMSGKC
jgi:hypothetical protein